MVLATYQRFIMLLIPTCESPRWTVGLRNRICRPLIRLNTALWKRRRKLGDEMSEPFKDAPWNEIKLWRKVADRLAEALQDELGYDHASPWLDQKRAALAAYDEARRGDPPLEAFMAEVEANDRRLFEALDRTRSDGDEDGCDPGAEMYDEGMGA